MNVKTLIQLLADVKNNSPVFFEDEQHRHYRISSISSEVIDENYYILLNVNSHSSKTLKIWELLVLLQQQEPTALIFIHKQKNRQQIFGLRFADGQVYLK